jgi:hypothetical protein
MQACRNAVNPSVSGQRTGVVRALASSGIM